MEVVIGIVFSIVLFLFFLQNKAGAVVDGQDPAKAGAPAAVDASAGNRQSGSVSSEVAVTASHLPQDSVLRRHFIAHVRQMAEDLAPPQPSDSVLRRHHEQLVASLIEECLESPAHLQALMDRYDAIRQAA